MSKNWSKGWSGKWWRQTTVADLQQEMTGTTSVFGRDKSITVTFNGDVAETGDGTVTFPRLDPSLEFDDATVRLFRGWVDSESAIARFSDRAFINAKSNLKKDNPLLYDVFKAVESSRVESNYTDFYVGAGSNLSQVSDAMMNRVQEVAKHPTDYYPAAISMLARHRMKGVYNSWSCTKLEKLVDRPRVEEWVDAIQELRSTEESFALAQSIIEDMQDMNPPPPPPQGGGGEGEGDGDQNQEGSPNQGEGQGDGNQSQGYTSVSMDDVINDGIKKAQAELKIDYDINDKDGPYIPFSTEYDKDYHWSDTGDAAWTEDIPFYQKAKDGMDAQLATAKRKLELMIQATQKLSWDPMKERGRFDSRRLVGAYQGETHVFKVKKDRSDLDTAVSLCVDLSGSMSEDGKFSYAFLSTIVMAELLHKIGVPFEITGFDASCVLIPPNVRYGITNEMNYGRIDAIRTHHYKRFADRFFDCRKYLHYMGCLRNAGGNNVDGESIAKAAKSLMKRPEKRRILFVFSDGQPHAKGNHNRQYGFLQRTVKDIARHVEVVGIGICSDAVESFYPDNVVIWNADKLPETLLNLLGQKLLPSEKIKKKAA